MAHSVNIKMAKLTFLSKLLFVNSNKIRSNVILSIMYSRHKSWTKKEKNALGKEIGFCGKQNGKNENKRRTENVRGIKAIRVKWWHSFAETIVQMKHKSLKKQQTFEKRTEKHLNGVLIQKWDLNEKHFDVMKPIVLWIFKFKFEFVCHIPV